MTTPTFGQYPVSLSSLKVAKRNSDGTYQTAVPVPGIKATVKPVTTTDELMELGMRKRVATMVIGVDVTMDVGGYPMAAIAAMSNASNAESGASPARVRRGKEAGRQLLPEFGLIGVAVGENGSDVHYGCPILTLTDLPEIALDGEKNAHVKVSLKASGVADEDGYAMYPIAHETAEAANFTTIFS